MPELPDGVVTNSDVKQWRGLHLLHFHGSACSAKVRVCLAERGLTYVSRIVDPARAENYSDWFLSINPRGLVPVLVHDGRVLTESNDIIEYLDRLGPAAPLMGTGEAAERTRKELAFEDSLHMDLRSVTFGFAFPSVLLRKPQSYFKKLESGAARDALVGGGGQGVPDQLRFYRSLHEVGMPDDTLRASVQRFHAALQSLDSRLRGSRWLGGGDSPSAADIAWFVYVRRLVMCGYPLDSQLPALLQWYGRCGQRPGWLHHTSTTLPAVVAVYGAVQKVCGCSLVSYMPGAEPAGAAARVVRLIVVLAAVFAAVRAARLLVG
eukprot:TRINITY_DN47311_c0_g1_i1.p1 TRINITY_DN47311_c0_g1~~TRINITY_DN47311_c0_g1_i1.p1  ORF type:complete len:321 (+),score=88.62 TRINITY_DN47311_c0_g1_i1:50-1012(+)